MKKLDGEILAGILFVVFWAAVVAGIFWLVTFVLGLQFNYTG